MREHPGWLRRYRLRSQPGCRRRRKRKPEKRERSRGLRTLPSEESRRPVATLRPDNFLNARRIARCVARERLERKTVNKQLHFSAVENFALQQRFSNARQGVAA